MKIQVTLLCMLLLGAFAATPKLSIPRNFEVVLHRNEMDQRYSLRTTVIWIRVDADKGKFALDYFWRGGEWGFYVDFRKGLAYDVRTFEGVCLVNDIPKARSSFDLHS